MNNANGSIANDRLVTFTLGGMAFEYDEEKNKQNIEIHGISFKNAARVFFDYDRIELFDEENSEFEDRYNTIGDLSAGDLGSEDTTIGHIGENIIIYVVYTERFKKIDQGTEIEVTRIISAREASKFERGVYYGKYQYDA